jgi:hypothetical protein
MTNDDDNRAMACLSAIRKGREWLDTTIVNHMAERLPSTADKEKAIATARSDNAYHVAEFFYVAEELQLFRPDRLPNLIARHNADMRDLLKDPKRAWNMGLSPQRVADAIFSDEQVRKIFEGQDLDGQERVNLDQSDVSRLLSPLMSIESCRQILRALSKGVLLKSWGYGRVFISSPGILEGYFREHLLIIDRAIYDPA